MVMTGPKSMDAGISELIEVISIIRCPMNQLQTTSLPNSDTPSRPRTVDAVEKGLETLKQCAPFVIVFNQQFSSIGIKSAGETIIYKVSEESQLPQVGLREITVDGNENGNENHRVYVLAESAETSIAVPLEVTGDSRKCLPLNNTPRLFLGFPLIGTEDFSFPAVVNSLELTPTEDRDGVYLGQGNNEANHRNQQVIQQACQLLTGLIQWAASSGWRNTYVLANIPTVREQKWLNPDWLRENLKERLVEKIRQTPSVLNEADEARKPTEATLPMGEADTDVESLWDLLDAWQEAHDTLSRRNEAAGWSRAVTSWASLYKEEPISLFPEVVDGERLASMIDDKTHKNNDYGTMQDIQDLLQGGLSAIEWLNRFHAFLNMNGLRDAVRDYHIVLDQDNFLDKLSELHRDKDISDELKDIAKSLDWSIRQCLRDKHLTSLEHEDGAGVWDDKYVVDELIRELQKRAAENLDDNFAKASVGLFAWIVSQENWSLPHGFPVFAEETSANNIRRVIKLEPTTEEEDRPLAPVLAWSEDLQLYSELFPRRRILADAFFEAAPNSTVWRTLDEQGFLKNDVIITKKLYFDTFLPDENLTDDEDHKTAEHIAATSIAFLIRDDIGIMARVRQSQNLARLFWCFLTEWLVQYDLNGLQICKAICNCGNEHSYYPAEWLVPIKSNGNKWVPIGKNRSSQATAESLANLLRGSRDTGSLIEDPAVRNLLGAIGVSDFDLMRQLVAPTEEGRAVVDKQLIRLMTATRGELSPILEFAEDLKNDEGLPKILAERRKNKQIVCKNQRLGQQVEDLVKESLQTEGFAVRRTGIGSDFEISAELGEVANLELTLGSQSWSVEVKATRDQRVRMTDTQAKTAAEKGYRFLLCVVPVESGDSLPELESVRADMRFVANIGDLVKPLCNHLDELSDYREGITADESAGVQLEIASGAARIRVARSVWEHDGFPLKDLAGRLASFIE